MGKKKKEGEKKEVEIRALTAKLESAADLLAQSCIMTFFTHVDFLRLAIRKRGNLL